MKSMSSVCVALINTGGVWSVEQLHQECIKNGVECLEAQVYGAMQVYASQKKIARGEEKRTYVRVGVVTPVLPVSVLVSKTSRAVVKEKLEVAPKVKVKKEFDAQVTINEMIELLGPAAYTRLTGSPFTILLLPEENYTAKYLVDRLKAVVPGMNKWLWYKNGSGYIVGGLHE